MEVSLEFISWHKCLFELMPLITSTSNMPRLKSFIGQVAIPVVIFFLIIILLLLILRKSYMLALRWEQMASGRRVFLS